ncbi:MAG: ferredoxin [Thermoleophilaceae bacterium]
MTQAQGPVQSTRNGIAIEVDRELCYGFGDCVDSAPGVFELDDDEKSVVVDPNAQGRDDILMAAQDCPVDAITITDGATGEQIYP